MTNLSLAFAFVVSAVINAGATHANGRPDDPDAESPATSPTVPGGARTPRSPKTPDVAPTVLAQKSGANTAQAPHDSTPAPVAGQIRKRWDVPPLAVPEGKIHFPMTNSAAINDDGTRVIVANHPAVDIWDAVNATCVRAQSAQDWGYGCNAIIARDASHFYVRNDTTKKVELHDGRGTLIGSKPAIGFAPPHGLKRPGDDFAPRTYVMGSRLPADCGIFSFDPKTGALRIVVRIKDIWDVEQCLGLVQRPSGEFLAYYGGGFNRQQGLYAIAKSGKFTPIPGIPSKDMKRVDRVSLSPDGRYLAFQGTDRLEAWDTQTRQLVIDWRQQFRTPQTGRFTGDGRLAVLSVKTSIKEIATAGLTGGYVSNSARLDVLEIPSLRLAGQLDLSEFEELAPTFAFSPNGRQLVVADWQQVALVDVDRTFPGK